MADQGQGMPLLRPSIAPAPVPAGTAMAVPQQVALPAGGQSDASTGGANRQLASVTANNGRLPFSATDVGNAVMGRTSMGLMGQIQGNIQQGGAAGYGAALGNVAGGTLAGAAHAAGAVIAGVPYGIHQAAGLVADQVAQAAAGVGAGMFGYKPPVAASEPPKWWGQGDFQPPAQVASQGGAQAATQAVLQPGVLPASINAEQAAAVLARMAAQDKAQGISIPRPGVLVQQGVNGANTILTAASRPDAATQAVQQAAVAQQAPVLPRTQFEQINELPAGTQQRLLSSASRNSLPGLLSQISSAATGAANVKLRDVVANNMLTKYNADMQPVEGESLTAKRAREQKAQDDFRAIAPAVFNPASVGAGVVPGVLGQPTQPNP